MNIEKVHSALPEIDAFLRIEIEFDQIAQVLPDYKPCPEYCVCLYGMSEKTVDDYLREIEAKAGKYIWDISERIAEDTFWDLECKPILLFETKETLDIFLDFANVLDDDSFCEFISELQLDYNEPWTHVQMIKQETVYEILDHYEGRYCDE